MRERKKETEGFNEKRAWGINRCMEWGVCRTSLRVRKEKKEMGRNEAKMSNYCKPVCVFVGSNLFFPAIHNRDSDMRERETESV